MSGSTSRRKGASYENTIRKYIEAQGFEVINPNRSGYDGDDVGFKDFPWLSGECKNVKAMSLSAWVGQAQEQAPEGGVGIVIHHKARNGNPGNDYVTMALDDFLALLERLR